MQVAVDQVRWGCGAWVWWWFTYKERRRQAGRERGNSTDNGNSEDGQRDIVLLKMEPEEGVRRGQKEKRGVRELREWEKGSWQEVKKDGETESQGRRNLYYGHRATLGMSKECVLGERMTEWRLLRAGARGGMGDQMTWKDTCRAR